MVSPTMRRYRVRREHHEALIGTPGTDRIDPQALFGRSAPLRLEIGFGHGAFLEQLAAHHPDEDVIGVERDPLRVTKTAHRCAKAGIDNVRLYEDDAHAFARQRLPEAAFHRAYCLFSDPWPKLKHRRRRVVNRGLMVDLAWALQPGGQLILATDCHEYAMQMLSHTTTMPGVFRNGYQPAGYRFDVPVRFGSVFLRHKTAAGCRIAYLLLHRTEAAAPPRPALGLAAKSRS